jgi:hypothetical protein
VKFQVGDVLIGLKLPPVTPAGFPRGLGLPSGIDPSSLLGRGGGTAMA